MDIPIISDIPHGWEYSEIESTSTDRVYNCTLSRLDNHNTYTAVKKGPNGDYHVLGIIKGVDKLEKIFDNPAEANQQAQAFMDINPYL
jgi:hypothetical protein